MAYTIASVSTPSGSGAISIVRLCGERSLDYALCFFHCKELSGSLEEVKKSEKLLKFELDLSGEKRVILSGIKKFLGSK